MAQAVSLQELEKAVAFCSHLELNCHLKELSSAFIPKKNNYLYGADRQIGKHIGNCFVDLLPLLSPCSKWKKIETKFSQQRQEGEEVLGRAWASRNWNRREQTLPSIPWSWRSFPKHLQLVTGTHSWWTGPMSHLLMSSLRVAFAAFGVTVINVFRELTQRLIAQCHHWDSVRKTISSLL